MDKTRIRPIAVCVFRSGDRILVSEGFDDVKQDYYYRPLGGGIDYGETSEDAVVREIKEETGADVTNVELLDVIENIFVYNGEQGHEIVFVFDAQFTDRALYELDEIDCFEHGNDARFKAVWKSPAEIANGGGRLVPEQLEKILRD